MLLLYIQYIYVLYTWWGDGGALYIDLLYINTCDNITLYKYAYYGIYKAPFYISYMEWIYLI